MKQLAFCTFMVAMWACVAYGADVRYETGSSLLQKCSNGSAECGPDLVQVARIVAPTLNLVCVPASANGETFRAAFASYAKAHPDLLWHGAADVVTEALFEAFPCDETPARTVQ